jgi:hypothetical protein
LDFGLWGWMKSEIYKEKVNTRHELQARIMNGAALIKERQDDLGRTTHTVTTRGAKCIEVRTITMKCKLFVFCIIQTVNKYCDMLSLG